MVSSSTSIAESPPRTTDPRALVPTARTLLERLAGHHPDDKAYDDIAAALSDLAVLAFSARGQVMPFGRLTFVLTDLYDEVASLVSDLASIHDRDVQARYLGDELGHIRYRDNAALAAEHLISTRLDEAAETWLGVR